MHFLLNKIAVLNTASTDTIISVFSSCSVAIGLAILSKGGNFSKYSSILVGDVLSITKTEIVYLIVIFVGHDSVLGVFASISSTPSAYTEAWQKARVSMCVFWIICLRCL